MGHARSILVVEDDDALRRMLTIALGRLAQVIAVASASEALTHLTTQPPPAVIVTDVMMPGITGLELAKSVRKMPHLSHVPIVMLSAKSAPSDVVVGINAGARHYVTKPFRSSDLESKIQ